MKNKNKKLSILRPLLPLLGVATLSACGWVDSTGKSAEEELAATGDDHSEAPDGNSDPDGGTDPDNSSFDLLPAVDAALLTEENSYRLTGSSLDAASSWEWQTVDDGDVVEAALAQCGRFNEFREREVVTTLSEACTDPRKCELPLTRAPSGSGLFEFDIRIPKLRAPVALAYHLDTVADDLQQREPYTLCLFPVNEAPDAADDEFTINVGDTRVVRGSDTVNLISNDRDDLDNGNQSLRVLQPALIEPRYASIFELGTDGGFTYRVNASLIDTDSGAVFDQFQYQLTDGTHVQTATVSLRIVNNNSAPELTGVVPAVNITSNTLHTEDNPALDLRLYLQDPDGSQLSFSVLDNSLPAETGLRITPEGLLVGLADRSLDGTYEVFVAGSDGLASTTLQFTLDLLAEVVDENARPEIAPLEDVTVIAGEEIFLQVEAFDADGDELFYYFNTAPDFLFIDSDSGFIFGTAIEPGDYPFVAGVTDFELENTVNGRIRVLPRANEAPQAEDISNRNVRDSFTYDVSGFFYDPDGDTLTFSASGMPSGVAITPDGVITGSASDDNEGAYIIVVTADDGRGGEVSDGFRLRIID